MYPVREQLKAGMIRLTFLLFCMGTFISCSGTSKDSDAPSDEEPAVDSKDLTDSFPPTLFTVIGDVPYNADQRTGLIALINAHNAKAKSEFVVHIGDIKPGAEPCEETIYEDVSGLLKKFEKPTFVVLGDNEYNDCDSPTEALELWKKYFLHFNENWEFSPTVEYQKGRSENFAWMENGVLFLGLNLVGSSVHDPSEWDKRLADDADWVDEQFDIHSENAETAVLFGHANMNEIGPEKFKPFTDRFRASARTFGKPVLYVQGDGHFWLKNRPWAEKNILRVQIEGGAHAVQVTVDPDLEEPFNFDRSFLD